MKHTSIAPSACAAAFCLFACLPLSQAAITVYTDRAEFLAVTIDQAVDTFDDLPDRILGTPLDRNAESYDYSAASPSGFFPANIGGGVQLLANQVNGPITFNNISEEVSAFGAYMFGGNLSGRFDEESTLIITVLDDQGNTFSESFLADSNTAFFGFTTPGSFTSITMAFDPASTGFYAVVDDVTLAVVPEPSSAMLAVAGMFALAFHRRRKG